ncbi:MAG: hypothetical protein K2N18_04795 [Clostridia bacterium]|nr:hypothetical protein [Clostridia bacterium]
MKKKSLIVITACLAIALCVAGVGVGFAWYTASSGADDQFELDADGYLVVYFDEDEITLDAIKPAVAVKGAINNNVTDFDVLTADGSKVAEAATVVSKEGFLHYLNESGDQSAKAEIAISCEAYMVFADGSKEKLSLEYDLSVEIAISWVYINKNDGLSGDSEENTGSQSGENGLENTLSITQDDWKTPSKTKFNVDGSADVTMTTTMYFRQVDDLCYPLIREAEKIQVVVKAVVIPESDAEIDPAA